MWEIEFMSCLCGYQLSPELCWFIRMANELPKVGLTSTNLDHAVCTRRSYPTTIFFLFSSAKFTRLCASFRVKAKVFPANTCVFAFRAARI
jgi:hypothetical protein